MFINYAKDLSATDMDDRIIPEVGVLYKKVKNWHSFPRKLSPYEWINPLLAFKAFFEFQPISHWKGKLHEFLQAAIKDESICSVISGQQTTCKRK